MYSSGMSVKSLKQESAVAAATLSDETGSHMLLPVIHFRRAECPIRQHSLRRIADFPRRHGACRPQVQP